VSPNVGKRETWDSQSVISAHLAIKIRDKENYDVSLQRTLSLFLQVLAEFIDDSSVSE